MIEQIIPAVVTLVITPLINKFLKDNAKLIGYYGHHAIFKVENQIDGCNIKIMLQYSEADLKTWKDHNKIGDVCFAWTESDSWKAFLLCGNKNSTQAIIARNSPIHQCLEGLKTKRKIEQNSLSTLRKVLRDNILFPATMINTHSVVIRNAGKKTLNNVRLGHYFLPNFYLYQDVKYSRNKLPNGGEEICFPILPPKGILEISYLYFHPTNYANVNSYIESDECLAKIIKVCPTAVLPKWKNICLVALLMIGIATPIYLIASVIVRFF